MIILCINTMFYWYKHSTNLKLESQARFWKDNDTILKNGVKYHICFPLPLRLRPESQKKAKCYLRESNVIFRKRFIHKTETKKLFDDTLYNKWNYEKKIKYIRHFLKWRILLYSCHCSINYWRQRNYTKSLGLRF